MTTADSSSLPLAGLKVLDLSRVLAGPLCTQYLGDMGADVIKVESPGQGDDTREWPEFITAPDGHRISGPFLTFNRNKRSISVDLKSQSGRAAIYALAARADVVVESFAPGVAARLGVDAATLREINPRLVCCTITGFGSVGPLRNLKGYDLVLQAFCGMLAITGDANSAPMRSPFSPVDQATGMHALSGILAALMRRQATGVGCTVEASLFDTATAFLGYFLQNFWETGKEPVKVGAGHPALCPYGIFDTADRPMIVGIANDALWRKFCTIVGLDAHPDIAQFATNGCRVANRQATEQLVTEALRSKPRTDWFELLDAAGIPCSPVNSIGELAAHPHTTASGMVSEYRHPVFGEMRGVSQPLRFDGERCPQRLAPPLCGEHTGEVLRELGWTESDIDALAASLSGEQP